MKQNEQNAEGIQDNEYETKGQCSTSRILWLQGQCQESSQDTMDFYCALQGNSASSQGGSSWLSPLRSDGSQGVQAGEAGPVEPQLIGEQESQN